MICRAAAVFLLAPVLLLSACETARPHATEPVGAPSMVRNQGYALLYSTVNDESHIDKVLILKNPDPLVADLINAIAKFASDAGNRLQTFAKEDHTLGLDDAGLPEMETKTRGAISGATARQLLFSGGKEFEFNVLLTQHEALNYITHLAVSLSEQDTNEIRKRYLAQLAQQSTALHEKVVAQLKARYVGQPK